MRKDLYTKFVNNQCTPEELNEVVHCIGNWTLVENSKHWGFDIWKSLRVDNIEEEEEEKFSELFDIIQNRIDKKEAKERKPKAWKIAFMTWITRAAAILFLPLLGIFLYTLSQKDYLSAEFAQLSIDSMEVISPVGSRTNLQLSDGTKVHLNFGSKLQYPQNFTGDTREVILVGEGFFDVSHNPDKPFIVKTDMLNIVALGTAFNVLAYPGDNIIETTLVKGKVVLEQNNSDGYNKALGAMLPGQHVKYNTQTGNLSSTKGTIDKYIAWKNGKMVFDDTPITEAAKQLSRKYNVDIEVDEDITDYTYTVTLMDEPIMQILELMSIATPVSYKVLPRKKLPDGTFSKLKITIQRKK